MEGRRSNISAEFSSKVESLLLNYLRRCFDTYPTNFDKFYGCMKSAEEPVTRLGLIEPYLGMRYQQCIDSGKEAKACAEQNQHDFAQESDKILKPLM